MTEEKMKILLVEDNPGDARLMQEMLKEAGAGKYELSVAGTLDSALDRLRKEAFDAVLLDLNLPDSHGIITLKSIQGNASQIAVVVITGLSDDAVAIESLRIGAEDFLEKGKFDGSLLVRSLRYAIERKRVEKALHESKEMSHVLFISSREAIMTLEPPSWKFTSCNPATVQMFKVKDEAEFISYEPWALSPKQQPDGRASDEKAREMIETAMREGFHFFEWTHKRANGEEFLVEVFLTKVEMGGKAFLQANFRDITERKRAADEMATLQEQFQQSQKMEAIGQLAGGIAHDFNNLLTIIKGYSQLSLMGLKEGNALKVNIEQIETATNRAADLTGRILAFSRHQMMDMKVLNLNTIVENLEKMLHRMIGENIELKMYLTEDFGRVKTDIGQIEQVIMNLAVNAKDAMPDGGKLAIETANVELDETYARDHVEVSPGRYVMLSVSDTGIGMTPEVKERVFEPFFTTKQKGEGTGLGLATVYGIVKQSGGHIWVYSEVGKGTTLKIYLPRVDEPLDEIRKEGVVREGLPRGSETILVVEDEEVVRKLTVRILQEQGYRVLEGGQGNDAFPIADEHEGQIHLLLTDVVMPKMGGRELAERLASLRPGIKVLYMSGYTDNAIAHHGIFDKGINFIRKPFTVDGLVRKVREVLDK